MSQTLPRHLISTLIQPVLKVAQNTNCCMLSREGADFENNLTRLEIKTTTSSTKGEHATNRP